MTLLFESFRLKKMRGKRWGGALEDSLKKCRAGIDCLPIMIFNDTWTTDTILCQVFFISCPHLFVVIQIGGLLEDNWGRLGEKGRRRWNRQSQKLNTAKLTFKCAFKVISMIFNLHIDLCQLELLFTENGYELS